MQGLLLRQESFLLIKFRLRFFYSTLVGLTRHCLSSTIEAATVREAFCVFKKWLIGDMGTPGEYQHTQIHWYSLAAVAAVLAVVLVLSYVNRKDPKNSRRLLVGVAVFHIAFEILWRLIYLFVKGDSVLCWWPMYPCNLGGVLIPIAALFKWGKLKKMFYLFGFVGGVLTFALPEGIFSSDVMVFPIVKSILQHTGLLMIPLMEYICGTYRSTLKDMGWVVGGCLIHLVNCEGIDRLLGFDGDYMFFRSGMPFVIPGVPQFITLSVFALAVFTLLSFLSDIKGSLKFIKSSKSACS